MLLFISLFYKKTTMKKIINFLKKIDFFKTILYFLGFTNFLVIIEVKATDGSKIASAGVLITCLILFYKLRQEEKS
jgi:hypothetical protein